MKTLYIQLDQNIDLPAMAVQIYISKYVCIIEVYLIIFKAITYINDAIIDKQSSIN